MVLGYLSLVLVTYNSSNDEYEGVKHETKVKETNKIDEIEDKKEATVKQLSF